VGVEIQRDRLDGATWVDRPHPLHCRCDGCPVPLGSVAGDWLAARWRWLRGLLRRRPELRDADGGLVVPAWVIEAFAEPDLRDAER
jgi:hypothetical protein